MKNKVVIYFHIFIFENKVAWEKMQLDRQFAWCPAAVECPVKVMGNLVKSVKFVCLLDK
jgi:hypothetical protein